MVQFLVAKSSTDQIYEKTGVISTKKTHHRTAAIQHAGFLGLFPHQINTLTKYMIDKQNNAYGSVCEYQVSTRYLILTI